MTITDLKVEIHPRCNIVNGVKHPFCEVSYDFKRDGVQCYALTRLFHPLDDTAHARAFQAQAFMTRQARPI
jgi:hypothetical protein